MLIPKELKIPIPLNCIWINVMYIKIYSFSYSFYMNYAPTSVLFYKSKPWPPGRTQISYWRQDARLLINALCITPSSLINPSSAAPPHFGSVMQWVITSNFYLKCNKFLARTSYVPALRVEQMLVIWYCHNYSDRCICY